jgi:nicotinamide-nucleotide amidase
MPHAATHARAAILSVGDELVLGQTLDTNSKWLSERLTSLGIRPVAHLTVSDEQAQQHAAFVELASRADVIICTGGLGPTADDLTRHALADAMHDSLIEDPIALSQVQSWYGSRGRPMPEINRVQALRPSRGLSLQNLHGTAPGLQGVIDVHDPEGSRSVDVFCLPGPPNEMFPMFESQILPRLSPPTGRTVRTRALHCFGIGESDLATRLGPLMDRSRMPLVGTTASKGVVSCRLRYEGPLTTMQADLALDDTEQQIRALAKEFLFGSGDDTPASVIIKLLKSRNETLGVVESCTGGMLGAALTDIPGSSSAFLGGLLTYTNQLKQSLANVPVDLFAETGPGAVSAECAAAMAKGGLEALGVHHALAITGIAGPDGAVAERVDSKGIRHVAKPVGTVFISRASRDGSIDTRGFKMASDRASVRIWSVQCALSMLWQHLAGIGLVKMLRQQ